MLPRANLIALIEDLRGRLERGELARLPLVQLQPWTGPVSAELLARSLLCEADYWRSLLPEEWMGDAPRAIQQRIAADLSALHERLVLGMPCPAISYRTQR